MNTYEKIGDNIFVAHPEGKMDIHHALIFERELTEGIRDNPNCHVIIDLLNVEYLSSTSLRIFVTTYSKLHFKGLKVLLCRANDLCLKIAEVTNFSRVISIHDKYEDALNEVLNNIKESVV